MCFVTSMTVKPYDDKLQGYFEEVNEVLKNTNHKFVSLGNRVMSLDLSKFESDISAFPSVIKFLDQM